MDIATASTNAATVKTPEEADSEALAPILPLKPLSFTNGVLKHRQPLHPHNPAPWLVSYRECLKNHAAAMGGHAVDGCGEFMPSPTCNPSDPSSLKCAACGCHRNFHRRDPEDPPPSAAAVQHVIEYQPHHRHQPLPPLAAPPRSPNSASPPPISSSYYPSAPHVLLTLSSCGLPGHPPQNRSPTGCGSGGNPNPTSRKRSRTKFTQNQKDRMYELAEKLGWKMQKRDDDAIHDFCNQIGVEKGVFKVWMHNNKSTFGKKDPMIHGDNGGATTHGIDLDNSGDQLNLTHHHHHHHHHSTDRSDELTAHPVATNGSSSSS